MSADWPLVTIESIQADAKGAIAIGPFGSRMKSDCYVEEGIPVIRGTNLTGGPNFEGEFVYITEEKADSLGSCNVYQYDLVFPHRGSIGEVGIVLRDERYVLSSSLMKLTCDRSKVNPKFLYYFFKSRVGRHELLKNASQVGTPGIGQPLTSLKSIEFRLPPKSVQDEIEETLTSLDNKIELNRQTNQTLEQIAQAIFKSWFVDFEPTRAKIQAKKRWQALNDTTESSSPTCYSEELDTPNPAQQQPNLTLDQAMTQAAMAAISGKSIEEVAQLSPEQQQQLKTIADLFPDALVESELGEIPEGWGIGKLGDLIDLAYGKALKKSDRCEGLVPVYGSGGLTGYHNKSLVEGPGVIVGRKGTVGAIYWENQGFFPIDTTFYVQCKSGISIRFAYYLLKVLGLENMNTDAAVPGLNRNNAYRIEVLKFPDALIAKFDSFTDPVFCHAESNLNQIKTVTDIRDLLLPKLLSGEIVQDKSSVEQEAII